MNLEQAALWYGPLSAQWQVRRFKHAALIVGGQVDPTDARYRNLPLFAPNHMESGTGRLLAVDTADEQAAESGKYLVRAGDILYSKIRPALRKVVVAPQDGLCSADVYAIRPRTEILEARFLFYLMLSEGFCQYSLLQSDRVAMPKINREELGECPLVFPELDLQSHIVEFLDRKTDAIDELIAKKQRLMSLVFEKRQALVTQVVAKGLDHGVPMSAKGIDWLGELPAHWRVLPIKRLARSGGKTFTDGDWIEAPYITDSGVRLIQTGNIGVGRYREQGYRYIDESTFRQLGCTPVNPGDVLICRLDGPVGRACLAPELGIPMITSVDNAVLKLRSDIDGRFLVYLLSLPAYLDWVQALCRVGGGFRFRISRSMLGDFRVPVPPKQEQAAIADYLDASTSSLRNVEDNLELSVARLREYRQALITAAVIGKLDVTEELPT
ncbi:restriction endonuclease subunit S [Sorangium sp. So ce216]